MPASADSPLTAAMCCHSEKRANVELGEGELRLGLVFVVQRGVASKCKFGSLQLCARVVVKSPVGSVRQYVKCSETLPPKTERVHFSFSLQIWIVQGAGACH